MTETTMCTKGLHDLTLENATYTEKDGRARCRACKSERQQRARDRKKRQREGVRKRAETRARREAQAKEREEAAKREVPFVVPPAGIRSDRTPGLSPEDQARYRLALLVRGRGNR